MRILTVFSILLLAPGFASAHSGPQVHRHYELWNGVLHLLSEPDHLAIIALAFAIGFYLWRANKKSKKQ